MECVLLPVRDWLSRGSVWEWLRWDGPGYINLHHGQDLDHESSEAAMEHHPHGLPSTNILIIRGLSS
jgi:hypothetical protein